MLTIRRDHVLASAVLLILTTPAMAQNADTADGAESLPPVEVTGDIESSRRNVLPDSRHLDDLFGTERSVLETPRQATVINEEMIDQASIDAIRDITRVSANTFSPNNFGNQSLPTIRGDLGEIFQNGLRRVGGNNGFGFPTSFNSVEQINVVKGATPVPLGPTQRVGGHINLVTKRPYLDRFRGEIEVSAGSFDGASSQVQRRVVADFGGPISEDVLGYRFSAEIIDDDGFYNFSETQSEDIFFALGYAPRDDLRIDFTFEHFNTDFADLAGFNRPTQNLIDNGIYITGTDPQAGNFPGLDAVANGENVVSPDGQVRLDRRNVLNHPDDFSEAEHTLLGLTVDWQLNDLATLTNRTLYQDLSKTEVEANSFVEIIDTNRLLQNRTELALDFDSRLAGLDWQHHLVTGVDMRYHEVVGFSQFTTEADNPIDLTDPIDTRRIPVNDLSVQTADVQALRDQLVFLNGPGVFVSPGANYDLNGDGAGDFRLSDTTDSELLRAGLFIQDDIQLAPRWKLLLGLRGDFYDVEARDALPPPGVVNPASDTISEFNPTGNASLTFSPTDRSSVYAAYNYTRATLNSLGGGYVLGADNQLQETQFDTESELFELGGRLWLLDETLFMSAAIFEQTRNLRNRDGSISGIETQGAEYELTFQPTTRFFVNFNAAYLDVRADDSTTVQGTRVVTDAFDNSRPDIINGTGGGSPGFTVFGPNRDRRQGLPDMLVSAFANYRFESGFGANLGVVATSSYKLDFLNTVRIPSQYTLNGSVFYNSSNWDFTLDLFNITDEENFAPNFNGGFFGATLVFPELPFHYLASVKYKF